MQNNARKETSKSTILFWVIITALILGKLWLTSAQKLCALPHNRHDDQLFIRLAASLIQGQWLGIYDNLTLAKGAIYPIWIALSFWLGVPLVLAQHLLYAAACLTAVLAIKPLFRSSLVLIPIFAAMLFNPVSFSILEMLRIAREGIYPALTLFVVGCAVGLAVRFRGRIRGIWGWSVGLGLAMAMFWLTREEGIWIAPALGVLAAASLLTVKPRNANQILRYGLVWCTALIFPIAAVLIVSSINRTHYGAFIKTEFDSNAFKKAYGALTRVKTDIWLQHVPVSRQARRKIYRVSPVFSELRPYLEGEIGGQYDQFGLKLDEYKDEIQGGWFMWALRDAVAAAGYYSSGSFPEAYYLRLAQEINNACRKGRLECYPERASMLPPWNKGYLLPLWKTLLDGSQFLIRFDKVNLVWPQKSLGTDEETRLYRDITRSELCQTNEETTIKGWTSSSKPIGKITMQGYFQESVPFIFETGHSAAAEQISPPNKEF